MSKIIKVIKVFSNPKNVKNDYCSISTKRNKTMKPCLVDLTTIPCDLCVFYKDNQKAVNTIVQENSNNE